MNLVDIYCNSVQQQSLRYYKIAQNHSETENKTASEYNREKIIKFITEYYETDFKSTFFT